MGSSKGGSLFSTLLLTLANILIPVSILIFATGFFPYKPMLPGLAQYEALDYGTPPEAPFDKLVFMVVDALRSDFVYSENSGFQFTQSLIRDGSAIPFTAHARSPTVTMPRLKAITTGSIPSFVDLILNFDEEDTSSTLAAQDTWLAQIKAQDRGKLLLFGDDTWLKLFPDTFDREDGTSSFFVADFTEVDHNVTRNIAGELQNDDWGLMVLHYLGLDHIGHKSGPRSPNMIPKQQEMDTVVQTIYSAMETQSHLESALFVLCGDHGMNDAGNHGASSPGETSPALVFLSPKLKSISGKNAAPAVPRDEFDYYSKVEQSDIAPTVAALLGFPVSKNNLGAFIPEFLPFWSKPSDQIQILIRNARQILDIVTAAFGVDLFDPSSGTDPCSLDKTDVNALACRWQAIDAQARSLRSADKVDQTWLDLTFGWLKDAQDLMSGMASNYNMTRLYLGTGLAVTAVLCGVLAAYASGTLSQKSSLPLFLLTISYAVMMFASSYVEEEHHFWYWCTTMYLVIVFIRDLRRTFQASSILRHVFALVALRLIRAFNQTGQKHAGAPDLVKSFLLPNPQALWVLISITYVAVSFQILPSLHDIPFVIVTGLTSVLISAAYAFKLAFTAEDAPELVVGFVKVLNDTFEGQTLVWRARMVFILLSTTAVYGISRAVTGPPRAARSASHLLHHLYTLFALTQSRAPSIPLFLVSTILLQSLPPSSSLPQPIISNLSLLLQHVSFFSMGGTNAISSIDLSSAYNGISGFNIIAVGVLTFVSNWAGPIFWTSATNLLLLDRRTHEMASMKAAAARADTEARRTGDMCTARGMPSVWRRHVEMLTIYTTGSIVGVMVACTALRTHLFIWTVFSPKFLYAMAWSLAQHLLVNIGLGGFLHWIGAR